MLTSSQRDCLDVVLVSPRNPLNIGAVARAMANFGFAHLTVAAPYAPHWREAKSAIGAPDVLTNAHEVATLADAIAPCTFVVGTGTLEHRKPELEVLSLEQLAPRMQQAIAIGGRAALVFGPEKHGLTRDDLSHCHALLTIPTDARQPSMNLGQAAAVCLYELARPSSQESQAIARGEKLAADSSTVERLGDLVADVMTAVDYSPANMRSSNRHDVRLMLHRLSPGVRDVRRMLGLFRRILWRLQRGQPGPDDES